MLSTVWQMKHVESVFNNVYLNLFILINMFNKIRQTLVARLSSQIFCTKIISTHLYKGLDKVWKIFCIFSFFR